MSLRKLRKEAKEIGVSIEAERDDYGWSYWLVGTGWPDDNFCTTHDEIETKLQKLREEREK